MEHAIDFVSKIVMPIALFFFTLILNWIREDIKGVRQDINGIRQEVKDAVQKIFEHISDHNIHCKHIDHKGA